MGNVIALLGLYVLCDASFGGVILISIGHIVLTVGLALQLGFFLTRRKQSPFPVEPVSLSGMFLILYLVVCCVNIAIHWNEYESGLDVLKQQRYVLLILLALYIPGSLALLQFRFVRIVVLVSFGLSAVIIIPSILSYFTGYHAISGDPLRLEKRIGGVSGSVMTFAYTLQFFVLASIALVFSRREHRKWFDEVFPPGWIRTLVVVAYLAMNLAAFYLSGSRGALAGLAMGGLVLLFYLRSAWLWGLATAGLSAFLLFAFTSESRLVSFSEPIRMAVWKTAILTFFEHPFTGIGYRQLELHADTLAQHHGVEPVNHPKFPSGYVKGHAHNNLLEALAGLGVMGGFAFCGFVVAWMWECSKWRTLQLFLLPGAVAFTVSGMFESTFIDSEIVNVVLLMYLFSQVYIQTAQRSINSLGK